MASAVLYFRTEATIGTAIDSLPSAQKLIYNAPNDILEAVSEVYENRINVQQSVNSSGVRRIFLRDDGLKGRRIVIRGIMTKTSSDITKIKSFRKLQQTTPTLIHGVFGLRIDNAPEYTIDCTSTRGLMIGRTSTGFAGQRPTLYGFEIELFFGGEHE